LQGNHPAAEPPLHDGTAPDHRKHAGKNAAQADQHDQDLEQIAKPTVTDEPIHDPKKNRPNDNDDENVDDEQNHGTLLRRRLLLMRAKLIEIARDCATLTNAVEGIEVPPKPGRAAGNSC
jgi:hypothetical protein